MDNERNQHQIIRKDARNCFVESLNDAFAFGKVHLGFATYDTKLPAGQRQTNSVHIYIAVDEFLKLCRKLSSGEMRQEGVNTGIIKKVIAVVTCLLVVMGACSALLCVL